MTTTRRPWTPGEWTLGDENNQCCEVCLAVGEAQVVISLDRSDRLTGQECVISREEMLANARLIAAAPALAEACIAVVQRWDSRTTDDSFGKEPRRDPPDVAACRAALDACGWVRP
jgi:hypothetical protein